MLCRRISRRMSRRAMRACARRQLVERWLLRALVAAFAASALYVVANDGGDWLRARSASLLPAADATALRSWGPCWAHASADDLGPGPHARGPRPRSNALRRAATLARARSPRQRPRCPVASVRRRRVALADRRCVVPARARRRGAARRGARGFAATQPFAGSGLRLERIGDRTARRGCLAEHAFPLVLVLPPRQREEARA